MIFSSDNWAGAHPKIMEGLARHAGGFSPAYGNSDLDKAVEAKFSEIFERDVAVFFVATGTAANSLAMASLAKPGGVGYGTGRRRTRRGQPRRVSSSFRATETASSPGSGVPVGPVT